MTGTVARRPLWRAGWPPVPSLELAAPFQIHVLSKAQRLSPDPEHQNLRQPPASHEGTRLLSQDKSPRLAQPRPADLHQGWPQAPAASSKSFPSGPLILGGGAPAASSGKPADYAALPYSPLHRAPPSLPVYSSPVGV